MSDPGTLGRALLVAVLVYLAVAFMGPPGTTALIVVKIVLALVIVFLLIALAVHRTRRSR